MLNPAEFYAEFQSAGLLSPAVWTAQPGGTPASAHVRHRSPTQQVLGDDGVIVVSPTARWPDGQWPAAKRGDHLDVTLRDGATVVQYRIRELARIGSGSQVQAELERR